ncbi:MAG TPA: hypothetical protein VFM18_18210 [Methanosarcina sp.]|nr:hypothetical protein [Methanosarcina sp.]
MDNKNPAIISPKEVTGPNPTMRRPENKKPIVDNNTGYKKPDTPPLK